MSGRPMAILLVLAAASAPGCGTSSDRDQVRDVATAFAQALERGDGAQACAQLTPQVREALIERERKDACDEAVTELDVRGGAPASVAVFAQTAQVELAGGDTLFLSRGREGWRIAAAGCRGHGAEPLDCEVEA